MFKRLLSSKSSKKKASSTTISTLDKLHETLDMLEKKEHFLQKKISAEVEKAKDLIKSRNKSAAIQCLKKKRLYESQIEQLGNFQLRVHDQVILLEGAKATTDTIDVLRTGASAVKSIQRSLSVNDIDKTMEELTEYSENMKQIQDALAAPVGTAAGLDEDELDAELEDLAELEQLEKEKDSEEQQLPVPPRTIPSTSSSSNGKHPANAPVQSSSEMDQLAKLQAEMAL